MRFDIENQVCVAQAFTGAATVSAHSYKKQTAKQDLSIGRRMAFLVLPVVNAGAGSTVQIEAIQADDAGLTSNVTSLGSVSVAAANFVKGKEIELPIPQGVMSQQFLGVRVTITGGTTTATLDAYLVPQDEIAQYKSFPKVIDVAV
jgi:hypothetical protein